LEDTHTDTQTNGRIYEVRRCDGLRCHDIHTSFYKDCFRDLKVDKGDTQHGDRISLHIFFQNKESRLKNVSEEETDIYICASLNVKKADCRYKYLGAVNYMFFILTVNVFGNLFCLLINTCNLDRGCAIQNSRPPISAVDSIGNFTLEETKCTINYRHETCHKNMTVII
jgi:hypothetical protein